MDKNLDELFINPPHLQELKKDIAEKQKPKKVEPDPIEDPRAKREYPFHFSWTDGSGKVWEGSFTNRILSIRDRQNVGVMRSRLQAGVPVESLDELTYEINLMVAHMSYSIVKCPDWAEDLLSLTDVRLLQAIYEEVIAHEAFFLGYLKTPEGSEK